MNGSSSKPQTLDTRAVNRVRPPMLSLTVDCPLPSTNKASSVEQPILPDGSNANLGDADDTQLSSPSSTSSSPNADSETLSIGSDSDGSGGLSRNLEILERLRRNVHKNLRLRPLRMSPDASDTPASKDTDKGMVGVLHTGELRRRPPELSVSVFNSKEAEEPSSAMSIYFTPATEFGTTPLSAGYLDKGPSRGPYSPALATVGTTAAQTPQRPGVAALIHPSALPSGIGVSSLFARLASSRRPLLIDTRSPPSYLSSRVLHSLNIAIPSLIMRRWSKPGGCFSLHSLRSYITTGNGKHKWDEMMQLDSGLWDGDIIVYDETMDERNKNTQVLSWAILTLLQPLVGNGSVDFLKGGMAAVRSHPSSHQFVIAGESEPNSKSPLKIESNTSTPPTGLFQLDTYTASRSRVMPGLEAPSTSPGPLLSSSNHNMLCDLSPSPSPSTLNFPHFSKSRKHSVPNLRRLDTTSTERLLPRLNLRTVPVKSMTHAAPAHEDISRQSSSSSLRSSSSLHSNLSQSTKVGLSPNRLHPGSTSFNDYSSPQLDVGPSAIHSPTTPMSLFASPATARPDFDQPPTTDEPLPSFSISTILPNFLFLGPEPTSPIHITELQALGVKRILNIAIECDDDQGLQLREKFERYTRIPMRDIVEEDNVARSVREACEVLDDARLHSAPTYVHCKAGKSRSVTAVIAYLIHANHWTLSRAYTFVMERRKGISPNIGFVSELMTFEEFELGGKSIGVVNTSITGGGTGGGSGTGCGGSGDRDESYGSKTNHFGYGHYGHGVRRAANMRESLPPILASQNSEITIPGQLSAGALSASTVARVGDASQEVEVKDAYGRYRHARRAPVDENTLQPMRRVSKAGLESSYNFTDP